MKTLNEFIDEQLAIEEKATPGPFHAVVIADLFLTNTGESVEQVMEDEWVVTAARNHYRPLLLALREALDELEDHTNETTGYYSCACTGDSHDTKRTLKKIRAILLGEDK